MRCEKQDQDPKFGRPVAICYSDGVDVGADMVGRQYLDLCVSPLLPQVRP